MILSDEQSTPCSGLYWYGMQNLPPLLDAFTSEIDGVKDARDSEYIHRMRVASRRLRAALPLFRPCFTGRQYAQWMQEITRITRALGAARDADVQIAYLRRSLKKGVKRSGDRQKTDPGGEPFSGPAIRYLLSALEKERGQLQTRVLSALATLEKSGVIDEMRATFETYRRQIRTNRRVPSLYGIPPVAALRIGKRLVTMLSFEPWVVHPEAVAEHHATRIAAKKLRYTMEIYGSVYRNGLKKPIARVKRIQEILGSLHDCDVWIDQVTRLLMRERTMLRSHKGTKRPDTATLSSLKVFLLEQEKERKGLHRQFMRYWMMLARTGIWTELVTTLDHGRKKQFRPPAACHYGEARPAVENLAMLYPETLDHSRHVTNLSLMLFDCLTPLHQLGTDDRLLLEYAGLLHDIGWKFGQEGHNRRSAEMVFTDEKLPFDFAERGIIGIIVFSHRGKAMPESHPFFPFLSPFNQKKALVLAAVLRVADGLDYLHNGSVREIRCMLTSDGVVCDTIAPGDVPVEKERARKKADLFIRVFDTTLVIR